MVFPPLKERRKRIAPRGAKPPSGGDAREILAALIFNKGSVVFALNPQVFIPSVMGMKPYL
jgi:hypothetical protein